MVHLAWDSIQIYIDGIYSKSIEIRVFKSLRILNHCSLFQTQLLTIQAEGKIFEDKNVYKRRITILSDSPAAIKPLDSSVISSKKMQNFCRSLNEMADSAVSVPHGYQNTRIFPPTAERMIWPEGSRLSHSLMNSLHWGYL